MPSPWSGLAAIKSLNAFHMLVGPGGANLQTFFSQFRNKLKGSTTIFVWHPNPKT
jgi:hypothetical protein